MTSVPDELIKIGPPTHVTSNQEAMEETEIIEPMVLFINEETLSKSPQITVKFDKELAVMLIVMIVQQIMTEFRGAVSEQDTLLAITKIVINLMNQNGH
jgi:hypothetical protein